MSADLHDQLAEEVARFTHDPLGFVRFAFPWGEAGTDLAKHRGPRRWQAGVLRTIGEQLRAGEIDEHEAIQVARASGHGIGKSALVAWLVLWAMSTREDTRGVVTANTEGQLRSKTWPEVSKWYRMLICRGWFRRTATAIYSADPNHEKTWRIDAIPWSETNTEAFAGLHNEGKRVLVIFDEASAIDDAIWEVTEGALTDADTEIIWCVFGNPTRNSGRFRQCFGRLGHRWDHEQIDSRTVEGVNTKQLDAWVDDYGDDSDFVRVRVKGQFPRAGSMQLIPSDIIDAAAKRDPVSHLQDPVIVAVDVARFGDDQSVICLRRGRDARTVPPIKLRGVDTMQLAGRTAAFAVEHEADAIFVDETGVGAGVVDRLRQLGQHVIGVNFGSKADQVSVGDELVANKAAEMWCEMRQWLRTGGAIEDDVELISELESREYGYDIHNRIKLEKKDDLKKRGLASPDVADALAITFAYPVAPRPRHRMRHGTQGPAVADFDYDPLA